VTSSRLSGTSLPVVGTSAVDSAPSAARVPRLFDRLVRLYGEEAVLRLRQARVAVFGVGGVGSFAAEALARSAVGHLALIDFDDVCVTNTNRQLQALAGTAGKPKAALLGERLSQINPALKVTAIREFYDAAHADALLTAPWPGPTPTYDYVVDCIDNMTAKAHLIATCRERGIPLVCAMGAGGKTDPTRIRVADLGRTEMCPLAHQLRKTLRRNYGFPRDRKKTGIQAVYSEEPRTWPKEMTYDGCSTENCVCPHKDARHSCDTRNLIDGTAVFVTGTFGLICAGLVVNALVAVGPEANGPAPAPSGVATGG
jgi:tRNA threonylcarbamoyladenosine dehydratase